MVILQTSAPLLIDRLFKRIEVVLSDERVHLWPEDANNQETRTKLLNLLPIIKETLNVIHRIHTIWFYLNGSQYQISKRLTGINYTAIRSWMASDASTGLYKVLGSISLVQLVLSIVIKYSNLRNESVATKEIADEGKFGISIEDEEEMQVRQVDKCSLCLEKRQDSTSTPCGHLFCWKCIHDWLRTKAQCPICREKFLSSRLVFLHDY